MSDKPTKESATKTPEHAIRVRVKLSGTSALTECSCGRQIPSAWSVGEQDLGDLLQRDFERHIETKP